LLPCREKEKDLNSRESHGGAARGGYLVGGPMKRESYSRVGGLQNDFGLGKESFGCSHTGGGLRCSSVTRRKRNRCSHAGGGLARC
jgi:hypothetical protein